MTKKQKLWLGIFFALFLVPEILWSPVFGLLPFGKNFVSNSDNHGILTLIVFIEFVGLLLSFVTLAVFNKKNRYKHIELTLLGLGTAWAFYIFYILFATLKMWS